MAYQLKITLRDVGSPPVWRRITVPQNLTFEMLHAVIQFCFGWKGEHMYRFGDRPYHGSLEIKPLFEEDAWINDMNRAYGTKVTDSAETKLCDVFNGKRKSLIYIYDFSNDWVHDITVEKIVIGNERHAVCIGGKNACPPECCAGPIDYKRLKYILYLEPNSEEAKDEREWLADHDYHDFDTYRFSKEDINRINKILENIEDHVE